MKKLIFFVIIGIASHLNLYAEGTVGNAKYEVRAAWLTTLGGLDWPHTYSNGGYGSETQKKELRDILDKYVEAGFNTILFQTRVRGTVAYPSVIEPWESSLSGKPGVSPGYDVLQYAIDECHKRGLKIHAWVVAIPLGKWNGPGCQSLRKKSPNLVKKVGDEGFMNPENRATADYLARLCREIVSQYDVDGIHLDYIRYPETWGKIRDKNVARDNITYIVKSVNSAVKALKPWVAMSCSPVGKYADTKRARSGGWNARDAVCQDAALWMKEGWMDILFPMMYFKDNNFYPFVMDWIERSAGRIIVPGLGIYFMHPQEKNWALMDITREMNVCRQYGLGICFFRSKFFTDNTKGLFDYTKGIYSKNPAIPPAYSWLSNEKPLSPFGLRFVKSDDGKTFIRWDSNGQDLLYNVYGANTSDVDVELGENLLMSNYNRNIIEFPATSHFKWLAVTSVDRYGNESAPCVFWMNKNADRDISSSDPTEMLQCDGRFLFLNSCDVNASQVVELHSVEGVALTAGFARRQGGNTVVDVSSLHCGHYKAYVVNRKGNKHLLGRFYKKSLQYPL